MIMKVQRPHESSEESRARICIIAIPCCRQSTGRTYLPDPAREAPGLRDALERVVDPVGLEYAV